MSFVLEVVEQYSMEGLRLKLKLQHLGHLMWRPSSLEETLMLGNTVSRRRVIKRMRWWDGITDSMDMSLRKLHEIVKVREACFAAIHVITKSQTWFSNWTIPMRTQGPVKPLALVGVEKDLGGRGGFPSSGAGPWIQGKEHKILNVLTNTVFLKNKTNKQTKQPVFCRGENFDWVCSLDFTDRCRRDMEWAESVKTGDQLLEVQAHGRHSALGGKQIQR